MIKRSPKAKQAAQDWRIPLGVTLSLQEAFAIGYDIATAKLRGELDVAREELKISHRLEQAAWKVANELLDQQPISVKEQSSHAASAPTADDAQMLAAELNDVATSLPSDRYSQSKEIIHRARAWIKERSAPTADVEKIAREAALKFKAAHQTGLTHEEFYKWFAQVAAQARAPLVEALRKARETIRALHGDEAWEIYEKHSPEMKLIDAALTGTGEKQMSEPKARDHILSLYGT